MSETATAGPPGCATYEYSTVRIECDVESLYRDAYRSFGWTLEDTKDGSPETGIVTIRMRRDPRMKNRSIIVELQRRCEDALEDISRMKRVTPVAKLLPVLMLRRTGSLHRELAARYELVRGTSEQARKLLK